MKYSVNLIICSLALGVSGLVAQAADTTTMALSTTTVTATTKAQPKAKSSKTASAKKNKKAKPQDTLKSSASAPTTSANFNGFDNIGADYSTSAVERPLILPQGMKQAAVSMNMNRISTPGVSISKEGKVVKGSSNSNTGWASDFAFETGLGNHVQVGGAIETILSPDTEFGFIYGNAQYGINEMVNARLDMGFVRSNGSDMNFMVGIGAPAKYNLNANTALIGGRSDTLAANSGVSQTDDIFTISDSSAGSVKSLGLPLGIEHSFNSKFSGRARTAYRAVFAQGTTTSFIPLNVDAQFTPIRAVDLVATMGFDGAISNGLGYTDFFNAGVMGRFRF